MNIFNWFHKRFISIYEINQFKRTSIPKKSSKLGII